MAGEPVLVLVVRDAEGTCYVIPHEALDEYRVPPERAATIEAAPGSDVSGFWSGLGGLVQVSSLAGAAANANALAAADKQRDLVNQQQRLRSVQSYYARIVWPP